MADRFPWFPFYAADWRLSNTVRAMTFEQRGVYVELLVIAWDDGMERPSLPDDNAKLAALTGLGKRWLKVGRPVLEMCFIQTDDGWQNERLCHVWEVQHARYELRSMAGKLGGKAKAQAKQKASNASRELPQKLDAEVDSTKNSTGAAPLAALVTRSVAAVGRRA